MSVAERILSLEKEVKVHDQRGMLSVTVSIGLGVISIVSFSLGSLETGIPLVGGSATSAASAVLRKKWLKDAQEELAKLKADNMPDAEIEKEVAKTMKEHVKNAGEWVWGYVFSTDADADTDADGEDVA